MTDKSKFYYGIQTPNLRRARSDQFTHMVMQVIEPYLEQHGEHDVRKYALRELHKLFSNIGADIVTDFVRAELGLPLRDNEGWTPDELRAMEARRLEIMCRPMRFVKDPTHPFPRPPTPEVKS